VSHTEAAGDRQARAAAIAVAEQRPQVAYMPRRGRRGSASGAPIGQTGRAVHCRSEAQVWRPRHRPVRSRSRRWCSGRPKPSRA